MAVLTAGFNPAGATNGSNIVVADAGDASSWDARGGTSGIWKYDNTHTLFGKSLAGKSAQTADQGFLEWTTKYGSTTETYGRFYIYFSVLPGSPTQIVQSLVGAGQVITIDGLARIVFAGATSTATISTGQWYRLEWHSLKNGTSTLDIYASADSISATETLSGSGITATWSAFVLGVSDANHTTTFWVAQVVEKGTSAIGPYPVNTTAPAVSGLTPSGSTLTAGNGTWNGGFTFTYTYQWTTNGSNIGGATSQTYVTQVGDVGNAIGCKVTATGVQATNESAVQASSNTITVTAASTAPGGGFLYGFR